MPADSGSTLPEMLARCTTMPLTGIGFEAEAAERIFDAFTQASETICSKFGGLGLGLAIAKAIVEGHGGIIRGSSAGPDQGATFTVELSLA